MRRGAGQALIWALICALGAGAQAQDLPPDAPPLAPTPAEVPPVARLVVPDAGAAQSLPILTVDQDELFLKSAWGKRVQTELAQKGDALAAENERIANGFADEERELTELRKTLSPEDFRARADEFDKRVVEVRRDRDNKGRELAQLAEVERATFFQAALPVLAGLMQERGAVAVLDQRMLFVSADSADVTGELIARMDKIAGPGPVARNLPDVPTPQQPVTPDAPGAP